jgi:EmrB/QacA subfamily drug resistance transporter
MTTRKGLWILLATILGSSMAFIDSSVVNVALPRLQLELNASATSVQWVVEAYALFLGSLILVGGSLGDLFGRKRIFALGIGVFALASIWCGLSRDITQLIIARAVQGIGGALLTPGSLSIIRASFEDEEQRGRAIGLWSGFSAITAALGPVIGGSLVEHASWRWVFLINIPLAIAVLIILFLRVPENRVVGGEIHLDVVGALLVTFGLGLLVFGLIESENVGLFQPFVLICVFSGLLFLALFLFVERHSPFPMMPLVLFRSRTFSGANLLTLFLYAALSGTLFFFPFVLINIHGYSPTAAGLALLPFTLLIFSLSRWSGGLVARYGSRLPLVVGPLFVACGYVLFALPDTGGSYWTTFFPAIVLLGLGMAIAVAPLTTTVMGAAEERYAGIASGINNAVARVAGLLAIAILGIVVTAVFNAFLTSNIASLHLSPAIQHVLDTQRAKLAGTEVPPGVDPATHAALSSAIAQSFVAAFRVAMLIGAGLALASSLCAWFMIAGKRAIRPLSLRDQEVQCGDNACVLTHARTGKLAAVGVGLQVPQEQE